ncbi:hypothetical protein M3Y95_01229500 [Aphelenchoides besseyi]|nr:hypothetical protein M3Y95_01229500 [Aphelenchoides besseyi]
MVTEIRSPVVENVILPRVKSIQKIAITNGINTRKLCGFCLVLSLCAFVTAFIKTSGSTVTLYRIDREIPHLRFSTFETKTSENKPETSIKSITGWSGAEIVDAKRIAVIQNITRFLSTDTGKWVTLTFNSCGGFANMIWRFASIYGIGRNTDRRPFIEHERVCWKWTMPEFYASLPGLYNATIYQQPSRYMTKRVTYGVNCCRYDNVSRLNNFYSRYKYVYLRGNILQSYKYFHEFKSEIREIFEFSQPLKDYVKRYADALYRNDTAHKLCIHTRLGDFKNHFLLESRLDFTNPAIRFVGRELKNRFGDHLISAVLIGQDRDFLKKIYIPHESFKTKYTIENLNRAEEIYFGSAHCDSLLLTASGSTFGWWMGYLMPENQQDRIFYNIQASKDLKFGKDVYDYDSFPPEWKRLTLIDNYTVAYEPRWRYQIDADRAREREEKEKADAEVEAQKLDVELVEVEAKGQEEKSEQTEETENDGPDVEMKREDKEFGPELKQPEVEENDT